MMGCGGPRQNDRVIGSRTQCKCQRVGGARCHRQEPSPKGCKGRGKNSVHVGDTQTACPIKIVKLIERRKGAKVAVTRKNGPQFIMFKETRVRHRASEMLQKSKDAVTHWNGTVVSKRQDDGGEPSLVLAV